MERCVDIGNGRLAARFSAKGAELVSLIPRDGLLGGKEVMWSGEPGFWPWHAPNLFPLIGALAEDALIHEGRRYPIKQHGFLRHSLCDIVEEAPDSCAFRLRDDAATRAQYPFAFALTIRYRLEDDMLFAAFELHNPAAAPLHACLGAHPGFRWPLAGAARAAHAVLFETEETAPVRRLDGRLLAPEPRPSPVAGRLLRLDDALFDADAIIFDRLSSRRITYGAFSGRMRPDGMPDGPAVTLDFPDFPHLGIWTKPGGAPFLCLEPWQGYASPAGFAGEFRDKPGVATLAPGETRAWRYSIRVVMDVPR